MILGKELSRAPARRRPESSGPGRGRLSAAERGAIRVAAVAVVGFCLRVRDRFAEHRGLCVLGEACPWPCGRRRPLRRAVRTRWPLLASRPYGSDNHPRKRAPSGLACKARD